MRLKEVLREILIVNNKALYASKDNIKKVEKIKAELGKKDLEKKELLKNCQKKFTTNYSMSKNKLRKIKKLIDL